MGFKYNERNLDSVDNKIKRIKDIISNHSTEKIMVIEVNEFSVFDSSDILSVYNSNHNIMNIKAS